MDRQNYLGDGQDRLAKLKEKKKKRKKTRLGGKTWRMTSVALQYLLKKV